MERVAGDYAEDGKPSRRWASFECRPATVVEVMEWFRISLNVVRWRMDCGLLVFEPGTQRFDEASVRKLRRDYYPLGWKGRLHRAEVVT